MIEPANMSSRRQFVTITLCGLFGWVATSAPVLAIGPGGGPGGGGPGGGPGGGGGSPPPPPPPSPPPLSPPPAVPEINPGAAASALVLLGGGTMIVADRFSNRRKPNAHESSQ